MIPDQSQASIKGGNWFIYKDGENIIQVWGSNLNGKEKVFLNHQLVSEQRSMKMQSLHNFKDESGQNYEVQFISENLLKGGLTCVIKKENVALKTFKTKYIKGKNLSLKRFLILIAVSAVFGLVMSKYELPDFTLIIFVVFALIVHFKTRDGGKILIE